MVRASPLGERDGTALVAEEMHRRPRVVESAATTSAQTNEALDVSLTSHDGQRQ
jgi:hypothetical protein